MFNTDVSSFTGGDTNIKVNAVSGTLVKNYKDSFFLRFSAGSKYEKMIFSQSPYLFMDKYNKYWHKYDETEEDKRVVVIQTMILADNNYLCELMWKDDFDKMFEAATAYPTAER